MKLPESVVLLDSLGDLQADNTRPILVCASHCGDDGTFARKLTSCAVKAVFLNNAGIGKNNAGISGLAHYEVAGVLACAVSHTSAEIGVAASTWESGVVSHVNEIAQRLGIVTGETVKNAVSKIESATTWPCIIQADTITELSVVQHPDCKSVAGGSKQVQVEVDGVPVTVADSITFLNEHTVGHTVVCGSHGGVSAGHYALKRRLKAVFFNDAGIGKNNAGIQSLDTLSKAGVFACTVDCWSAEIFNGLDALENGIVSVCNELAMAKGVKVGMSVKESIRLIKF